MPDILGDPPRDTECVDSTVAGNADTYLSEDVPAFVHTTFKADTSKGSLAIAGFSAGGMCSMMLALRHPDTYLTFGDFAGLTSPTVGPYPDPPATIRELFGGSQDGYNQHDPVYLMKNNRYPDLGGWFAVGTSDGDAQRAQATIVPLARSAGILTCTSMVPNGTHDFGFAAQAFQDALPWLANRIGVGPKPTGIQCSA
jgi:S-formylglutathione hydrolase FrmB